LYAGKLVRMTGCMDNTLLDDGARTMSGGGGGGWGCPHEVNDLCSKVANRPCDPGMKGCELYSRYVFFDAGKNTRLEQKRRQAQTATMRKQAADALQGAAENPAQEEETCD